jgi:hypothetical protein
MTDAERYQWLRRLAVAQSLAAFVDYELLDDRLTEQAIDKKIDDCMAGCGKWWRVLAEHEMRRV